MATVAPLLIAGHWRPAAEGTDSFRAVDPSTAQAIGDAFPRSGAAEVEQALEDKVATRTRQLSEANAALARAET